jgi:hypothetical protein
MEHARITGHWGTPTEKNRMAVHYPPRGYADDLEGECLFAIPIPDVTIYSQESAEMMHQFR